MQKMALKLPALFPKCESLPLLLPHRQSKVTLTQEQCACLISAGLLGILWVSPGDYSPHKFPQFDFDSLFQGYGAKTQFMHCICHYLARVAVKMPTGNVSFQRAVLKERAKALFSTNDVSIADVIVHSKNTIEDSPALLHADFANMYIGGGVLGGGCVQEEILFVIKPECLVSLLFCAKMDANETILITGAERFSSYAGYGRSMKYAGDYIDKVPRDSQNRIRTRIFAYDAVVAGGSLQFLEESVTRDLEKAYIAFTTPKDEIEIEAESVKDKEDKTIELATGNWGCGAFGGDKSLKFFQQLIACSAARKRMLYYTFGEDYRGVPLETLIDNVVSICNREKFTVAHLYKFIMSQSSASHRPNFFESFTQQFQIEQKQQEPSEIDHSEQNNTKLPQKKSSDEEG
eukprot:TRINITY_DN1739_c0_g1_i1.p1 TRINITY_DN1739_c0_g1~~TRINITY_DN1739_c0_g1_i1.p1  ORF type:complete len:403 (+),score=60.27 TRINITY_DN1739_c0_g1_i1:341-1549(+)